MSPRPEVPKQTDVTMRSVRPSRTLSMAPSVNRELPGLFGAASVKRRRDAGKARGRADEEVARRDHAGVPESRFRRGVAIAFGDDGLLTVPLQLIGVAPTAHVYAHGRYSTTAGGIW